MAIIRCNKISYNWKKQKLTKFLMPGRNMKTNKNQSEDKREQRKEICQAGKQNYEDLDDKSSLCKESRFEPFCG